MEDEMRNSQQKKNQKIHLHPKTDCVYVCVGVNVK